MYLNVKFLYQFLATFSALLTLLVSGIHDAWTSAYLPQLLNGTTIQITSSEGSWVAVFLFVGGAIGSVLSLFIIDKFGRKRIMLATSVPYSISSLLLAYANSATIFYVARLVAGIASGMCLSVVPLYLGEIADTKIRGTLGTFFFTFKIAGITFINIVGSYLSINASSFVSFGVVVIFVLTFIWMPESPYFLISSGRFEEAKKSLVKLKGSSDINETFEIIKDAVKEQNENSGHFKDLFVEKPNRNALLIVLVVLSTKQCTGNDAFNAYAQSIFQTTFDNLSPQLMLVIYYVTRLITTVSGSSFIDKIGRRPTLLVSASVSIVVLIVLGGFLHIKLHTSVEVNGTFEYLVLTFLLLLATSQCFLSAMPTVMLGELFAMNVKASASFLFGLFYYLTMAAELYFFQGTSDLFGMDIAFFSFAAAIFVNYILIFIFVFETKGKTLEEIQEYLHEL